VFRICIGLNTDTDADPDLTFQVNTDPDPAFKVNTDPDPGLFMTNILTNFVFVIHCFRHKLRFRPPQRTFRFKSKHAPHHKYYFNHFWVQILAFLDPDPYFQYGSGSRKPNSIRIRIQDAKSIKIRMDPDPKHCVRAIRLTVT